MVSCWDRRDQDETEDEGRWSELVPVALHPADPLLALILIQTRRSKMAPPLEEHRVADEFKPRGEFQTGLVKHLLQLVGRHVSRVSHLIRVDIQINIRLNEEYIVD